MLGLVKWPREAQSAPRDDDGPPPAYNDDDIGARRAAALEDSEFGGSLPFKPFSGPNSKKNLKALKDRNKGRDKDRDNDSASGSRNKYKWGKAKGRGTRDVKGNERFGTTKGKVQFKLVHDDLIKEAVEKKKMEGKDISKAPLLPDLDTTRKRSE